MINRSFRQIGVLAITLLFWYLAAYVLMMDWRVHAYDLTQEDWVDESMYRGAPYMIVHSDFTFDVVVTCWANDLFWPIDWLVHPRTYHPSIMLILTQEESSPASAGIGRECTQQLPRKVPL